ncbi:gag-Pol polyprotein [Trichonephila clavipes]|nr:gag-Pol polyprotein [Trichonephila clavipes]
MLQIDADKTLRLSVVFPIYRNVPVRGSTASVGVGNKYQANWKLQTFEWVGESERIIGIWGRTTLTDLDVGKSWSCLLDGQRRAQLSALPRVEGVAYFRIVTGHDYLQVHLFKIGLADSPLCPLCKSMPMTGEHLSDCPSLLHVLSQDNCGILLPARATSALYWTARRLMSERMLVGVI